MTTRFDLGAVLAAVTDFVLVVDAEARIAYINHVLPGFTLAGVLGSDSCSYLHPDHQADYRQRLARLFANGEVDEYEIRSEAAHHQGFNWYFVRMRLLEGSVPPVAVIASTDITERKRLEAHREGLLGELQESMAQIRALRALVPQVLEAACPSCSAHRAE